MLIFDDAFGAVSTQTQVHNQLGLGRILDIRQIMYAGYPADYRIPGRITGYCGRKKLSQNV